MLDINSFLEGIFSNVFRISINDVIDIAIVAYIFYKIFMFIKDTLSLIHISEPTRPSP